MSQDGDSSSQGSNPDQFLQVHIPSAETNTSDKWRPVTLYVVHISAVGRPEEWTVYRRYSKFYDLNVQLYKRFSNHAMPPIPPKRLIGKEDPQFIEQRRQELEEFLNALLQMPVEISLSEEVCLFLEVPEPLRISFLERDARVPASLPAPIPGKTPQAVCFSDGPPDEARVGWLIAQLKGHPMIKVSTIRLFEAWFLKQGPSISEAGVQALYVGPEKQGGLLEEVGNFEHSEVSSVAALGLLAKLLSHEYCNEAPLFQTVLRRLDLSVLSRMRLQHHIHRNRGQNNRLDSFRVLRALDLTADSLVTLLQDDFARREFDRWKGEMARSLGCRTMHKPSNGGHKTRAHENVELSRRALSTKEYRKIAERAFTQVQMYLTTFVLPDADLESPVATTTADPSPSVGYVDVEATASGSVVSPLDSEPLSGSTAADFPPAIRRAAPRNLPSVDLRSLSGVDFRNAGAGVEQQWRHVPCPEATWKAKYGLRVGYQRVPSDQDEEDYVARATMQLPFPAFLVACMLADHSGFIAEALPLKQRELPVSVVERLKQLADGHLIAQMHSASTMKTMQLGTMHEAYSELMECHLGAPSAPHVPVGLWLLKTVRIIPRGSGSSFSVTGTGDDPCSGAPSDSSPTGSSGVAPGGRAGSNSDTGGGHAGSQGSDNGQRQSTMEPADIEHPPVRALSDPSMPIVDLQPSYLFIYAEAALPVAAALGSQHESGAESRGYRSDIAGGADDAARHRVWTESGAEVRPAMQQSLPRTGNAASGGSRSRAASPRVARLKPSGVLVRPLPDVDQAEISLCALLHKDTMRLLSGDLLGERLIFWRTLENIVFALETLCPLPADFGHTLRGHLERCCSRGQSYESVSESHLASSPRSNDGSVEVELVEEGVAFD